MGGPGALKAHPVAYFSAEFGLHESLPIYSGGLGILAGDHLKGASDLGVPLVGVGLFYARGYFRQFLDKTAGSRNSMGRPSPSCCPCPGSWTRKAALTVTVETRHEAIHAAIWRAEVGAAAWCCWTRTSRPTARACAI